MKAKTRSYSPREWKVTQMAWQHLIPGCFGDQDANFALHPYDEDRAKEAIKQAKAAGASCDDFEGEMLEYLRRKIGDEGVRVSRTEAAITKLRELW